VFDGTVEPVAFAGAQCIGLARRIADAKKRVSFSLAAS
jgi:hypothetical protein